MRLRLLIQAPGGKYSSANDLLEYFPADYDEYREPFCYSAGIFAHIPIHVTRSISDLNPAPIKVFQRLRDDPSFADEIMRLGEIPKTRLRDDFYRRRELCRPDVFDEASYVYVSQYAHLGLVRPRKRRDVAFPSYARCSRVWTPRAKDLRIWHALLKATDIRCCDYAEVLERPGRNCLVFLDPPYEINHGLYDDLFCPRDWFLLAERLKRCRHKFLMTVGDDPLVGSIFRNSPFRIIERPYHGAEYRKGGGTWHRDLLVMNYRPPCDMRDAI